ncbi:nitrous oxide-stimulated promoter family protein [Aeromonas jandaei]
MYQHSARAGQENGDHENSSSQPSKGLARCRYGHGHKPACANCNIHCYAPAMRKQIQLVMRWSGPRMLLRHPWLAIRHLLDGWRKAPRLPHSRPLPP